MDELERARDVGVDSKHGSDLLHTVFVLDHFKRNRDAELKYLKLGVAGAFDVAVHVDFVVEILVVLHNEAFEGCVFVAFELRVQAFRRGQGFILVLNHQRGVIPKHNFGVDDRQVILVENAVEVCVVLQKVVCPRVDVQCRVLFDEQVQLCVFAVWVVLVVVPDSKFTELLL